MFFRTENFKDFIRFYPIVSTIVGIQLIIWLLTFFPNPLGTWLFGWGIGINAMIDAGQYWRLVTPIFLHSNADFMHVLFNSFSLVLFGPALEQMIGKWKFGFAYLAAGIIANIFTFLIEPFWYTHLGASGAVYGLLGLYIFMAVFRNDLIDPASKQIVTVFSVIGLVMTFLTSGINVSAHVFGFISGFAFGPIVLTAARPYSPWRNQRRPVKSGQVNFDPNRWKKKRFRVNKNVSSLIWWAVLILAILGLLSGLIF